MSRQSQYMAEYRRQNPDYVKRQRKVNSARRAALEILAKRYPTEFYKIYEACKEEKGITDVNS